MLITRSVASPQSNRQFSYYNGAKELFSEASMDLREWFSNSDEFMHSIPENDRGQGNVTQLLGVRWHLQSDELSTLPKFKNVQQPVTKRLVLKTIAAVYDPCGWFCPALMPGKFLMQELWLRKSDWDAETSDDLRTAWDDVWKSLQSISGYRFPVTSLRGRSDTASSFSDRVAYFL